MIGSDQGKYNLTGILCKISTKATHSSTPTPTPTPVMKSTVGALTKAVQDHY